MAEHDEKEKEKQTTVRVRQEIGELGQEMERRMREKVPAVDAGDMPHFRQASSKDLFARLHTNVCELKDAAGIDDGTEACAPAALQKAADIANLANLIRLRIEKAAEMPEELPQA